MLLVLTAALVYGTRSNGHPLTEAQRVHRIAASLRCPTCHELSVADSTAPASQAIQAEIANQVRAGRSDSQIRQYFVDRYTTWILLSPPRRGVTLIVWAAPVLAVLAAFAFLVVGFRRWRPSAVEVSEEDRALVERALAGDAEKATEGATRDPSVRPAAAKKAGTRSS